VKRTTIGMLVLGLMTLAAAPRAEAHCIVGDKAGQGVPPAGRLTSKGNPGKGSDSKSDSIVGLWSVTFLLGNGTLFDYAFEQWHSDGTELTMDVAVPPAAGNVCLGVWEPAGPRTVKLHHVGWNWDFSVPPAPGTAPGTLAGIFVLDMKVTVSKDGQSYSGTFSTYSTTFPGLAFIPGSYVEGTVSASRITVP
jgi:hypothetical protein